MTKKYWEFFSRPARGGNAPVREAGFRATKFPDDRFLPIAWGPRIAPDQPEVEKRDFKIGSTFSIYSFLPAFLRLVFRPLVSTKIGFKWLEQSSQVGSTCKAHLTAAFRSCGSSKNNVTLLNFNDLTVNYSIYQHNKTFTTTITKFFLLVLTPESSSY